MRSPPFSAEESHAKSEEAFPRKENPEPPTKLQRLSDKENHVSRHSELLQQHGGDRQSRGERSLYPPFLSWSGHNWGCFFFYLSPPSTFMPPSIVFLLEISVADHKQNPEWVCASVRRGSRVRWSRGAIQQSALPVSSVETWRITPTANKKKKGWKKITATVQHLSDVRILTD